MDDPLLEAPELSKDDKTDHGFVNWFKALNQVRGRLLPPMIILLAYLCAIAQLKCAVGCRTQHWCGSSTGRCESYLSKSNCIVDSSCSTDCAAFLES